MAQRQPTVTTTGAGSEELSNPPAADLSAAIDTLTQAAQALTTTSAQMMQMMHTLTSGTGVRKAPRGAVPAIQLNPWEDAPFSEAVPTQTPPLATPLSVAAPVNANPLLQTHILDPQPP